MTALAERVDPQRLLESAMALIELDIVVRLTPWIDARSVSMRGWSFRMDRRPKCAGAGSSPAARSSAATVRITSGTIFRISCADLRACERVMFSHVLRRVRATRRSLGAKAAIRAPNGYVG